MDIPMVPHQNITTMKTPEKSSAIVISLVREKMKNVSVAELRLKVFKVMERKKVGSQSQESFLNMMKIQLKYSNTLDRKARQEYLDVTTSIKIKDAEKCLAKEKKLFKKAKKKMEEEMGKNSRKFRNTMKKISEENRITKTG